MVVRVWTREETTNLRTCHFTLTYEQAPSLISDVEDGAEVGER